MSTPKSKRSLAVFLIVGISGWSVAGYEIAHQNDRISSVATTTCTVQSRGLKAQKYLTKAMGDIASLLVVSPDTTIPPGKAAIYKTIADLQQNAKEYKQIESKQPGHRDCDG